MENENLIKYKQKEVIVVVQYGLIGGGYLMPEHGSTLGGTDLQERFLVEKRHRLVNGERNFY